MSGTRFDELTKELATANSRRRVLKGLGAVGAALAGMLLGSQGAQAAEIHLCCEFVCFEENRVRAAHQCVRRFERCTPPDPTCFLFRASLTSKCSDCGEIISIP